MPASTTHQDEGPAVPNDGASPPQQGSSPQHQGTSPHILDIAVDVALRLSLLGLVVLACLIIVRPFVVILLWAAIIAVAIASPFEALVRLVRRRGLAALLISTIGIGLIVLPTWSMGGSLLQSLGSLRTTMAAGELSVPPPPPRIIELPVVGDRVFEAWQLASDDVQEAVAQFEPQIRAAGRWGIRFLAGIGGTVLQTIVSLIIATVLLTYREGGVHSVLAIARRVNPQEGEQYVSMVRATIDSVTLGVLGVAFIQAGATALLLIVAGFPAAAIVSIAALILAVVQLPVNIALLWPVIWSFTVMSTPMAIVFTVLALVIGAGDMLLKPLFLGRGVPVPTFVILIGAVGGMVSIGMMGLFLGAVIFGIGYRLLMTWVGVESMASPV
jgi:predicted PurR-regulated permease PerM